MATLNTCFFLERERDLRPLLGPMLPTPGAHVAGPGPLLGGPGLPLAEKWPRPKREGDLSSDRGPLEPSTRQGLPRIFAIDVYIDA